jgi:DNA-binding Lrp family transcriptional regulator
MIEAPLRGYTGSAELERSRSSAGRYKIDHEALPGSEGRHPMPTTNEAFLLVLAESGAGDVTPAIAAIDGVQVVHRVRGPYDALAAARVAEWSDIDTIAQEIRTIPGVMSVLVAPIIDGDVHLHAPSPAAIGA